MKPQVKQLWPKGLIWFQPLLHQDARGHFQEIFQLSEYLNGGVQEPKWVQDNLVTSHKGVLRGLHFQKRHPQAKLVTVVRGAIFDVAVDLRPASPTWGQRWSGLINAAGGGQLYVPKGFAHGYQALEDDTIVLYKCSDYYLPNDEGGLAADDPFLALAWPLTPAHITHRDQNCPTLARLFGYRKGGNP